MCQVVVMVAVLFLTPSRAESTEEQPGYTYNNYYAPSTLNFQDIYSSSLGVPSEDAVPATANQLEDPSSTPVLSDDVAPPTPIKDDFHLDNVPTHFVEFRPKTEPVTTPAPIFIFNSSFLKKNSDDSSSSTTSTTTEEPDDSINVLPIKKNYQRGVLDLLFPAVRVKSFKSVFDMFRRLLSHTF